MSLHLNFIKLPDAIPFKTVCLFLEGSFVDRAEKVLTFGNPGSGKTHLL